MWWCCSGPVDPTNVRGVAKRRVYVIRQGRYGTGTYKERCRGLRFEPRVGAKAEVGRVHTHTHTHSTTHHTPHTHTHTHTYIHDSKDNAAATSKKEHVYVQKRWCVLVVERLCVPVDRLCECPPQLLCPLPPHCVAAPLTVRQHCWWKMSPPPPRPPAS